MAESFGFQAEISQLLDLIISMSQPASPDSCGNLFLFQ